MFEPETGRAHVRVERQWPRRYVGQIGELRGPVQPTKGLAAAAAVAAAEAELSDTYSPRLLAWPGIDTTMLIFRQPGLGWSYAFLGPELTRVEDATLRSSRLHGLGSFEAMPDAIVSGRRHLAQILYEDDWTRGLVVLATDEERHEYLRNHGFLLAYRHARAAGEPAPHQWACDHEREFTPPLPATLSDPGEAHRQ